MEINKEEMARLLEAGQGQYFFCDENLRVTSIGKGLQDGAIDIHPGQWLREVFPGSSRELTEAVEKLKGGASSYRGKFELNYITAVLTMAPFFEGERLTTVLCCLDCTEKGRPKETGSGRALVPMISEKYRAPAKNILHILGMLAPHLEEAEDYEGLEWLNEAAGNCYEILRGASMTGWYYQLVNRGLEGAEMEPLNLSIFMEDLIKKLSGLFWKTGRVLQLLDEGDRSAVVWGNAGWLGQAMLHIIANACIYSSEENEIYIQIKASGDRVNVTVTDEGIGIAPQDIERIFEPFFSRQSEVLPEGEMGLGLGLPIAKRIIELHGGNIFLTSTPDELLIEEEGKNQGTSMVVSLPLWEGDARRLRVRSNTVAYEADPLSDMYLIFSRICDIKVY